MRALELQWLAKRYISRQSDVEKWRNQAHSLSGYQVMFVWRCQIISQLWFLLVFSLYFILFALCIPLLDDKEERYTKGPHVRSQTQSQANVEKSPIPSSSITKQSSTISDHTSATGDSRVTSHGLGEGSKIMWCHVLLGSPLEVKQKEQEHFIK